MSDKKYKTIGQVGRETDELLTLINKVVEKVVALEERVAQLEQANKQ
jgi:hypothetical protein